MSHAILELSFTKTLDAVCEAASTGNTLYVRDADGSLVCRGWFSRLFERNLHVADLTNIVGRVEEAFAATERTIELHLDPVYARASARWLQRP